MKEHDPFVHGGIELPYTRQQAIELNEAAEGKLIPIDLAGHANKNTEPGCVKTVLHVSSTIRPQGKGNA